MVLTQRWNASRAPAEEPAPAPPGLPSRYVTIHTHMAYPVDPWGFTDGKKIITSLLICLSLKVFPVLLRFCLRAGATAGGWSGNGRLFCSSIFLLFFLLLLLLLLLFLSLFGLVSLSCPCPGPGGVELNCMNHASRR